MSVRQILNLHSTISTRELVNPTYSGSLTHMLVSNILKSDEHRALDNRLVSDVSDFPKSVKLERGVVEFVVPDNSNGVSLMEELGSTHTILQHRKLQNIALMALWRYFVSSCKGADGLVGGMMSTLLEYSTEDRNVNAP